MKAIHTMTALHSRARTFIPLAIPIATMALCLLAQSPAALACGGGGSGSYRKPPRPGHQHQNATHLPQPASNTEGTNNKPPN